MKEFIGKPLCDKCGTPAVNFIFSDTDVALKGEPIERLNVTCPKCGYEWYMKTLDAPK